MTRKTVFVVVAALVLTVAGPALADLQNVTVGGEVRIEGNHVTNWAVKPGPTATRIAPGFLPGRAIGDLLSGVPALNGVGVVSPYAWNDNESNSLSFVEQRTRLNVRADFTGDVAAFIELDSYDVWGEDFRSGYLTGVDGRAASVDDLEVYQAYIEANEMFGYPLRLRVGRQELSFGSQWLVGPKDFGPFFTGRSFDAVRLTYALDTASVDVFTSKLFDSLAAEEDGDVVFSGIYGSYTGIEDITLDAYWLWLRDARMLADTPGPWFTSVNIIEDILGLDDYGPTNLHTLGLRAAGVYAGLDYDVEVAYQFGDADQVGFGFKPFTYGDDDADFDAWAFTLDLGYAFDITWQPRVHGGYSYYAGEDNRDLSFFDWINPFDMPEASVSFNRLFSNRMYNGFFDLQNDLSNVHVFRGGVNLHPTEAIDLNLDLAYFLADEPFDWPLYVDLGDFRLPIVPALPFLDTEGDDDLGVVLDVVAVYHYTEDLMFLVHWSHLFSGGGLEDGSFTARNGLLFNGGSDNEDADFFTVETRLTF